MPPKLCGKCSKIVYPTEELKCLDKVWHKGCFKCYTCNMTLNMKNYKGYDKIPYCNAHYPQTKHTVVADTPENRRIAENTKIQSNISYHAEFEKQKGQKTSVADDPEVMRVRQNMNIISNVSYHGDRGRREQMEMARPAEQVEGQGGSQYERRASDSHDSHGGGEEDDEAGRIRTSNPNPGRIVDYDPAAEQHRLSQGQGGTPYSNRGSAGAKQVYDSNIGKDPSRALAYHAQRYYKDEMSDGMSARDAARRVSRGSVKNRVQRFSSSGDDDPEQKSPRSPPGYQLSRKSDGYDSVVASLEQPPARRVGSISDYDPVNDKYGSVAGQYNPNVKKAQPPQQQAPQQQYQPPPQKFQPPPEPQQPQDKFAGKGMCCQALYDYDAADADEVSFKEGDMIIYSQPIDAGWMEGTVERSGKRGMLPSNYVEKIN